MKLVARKIIYEVHFDQVDADGHTVDEPVVNGRPELGEDGQPTGRVQRFALYHHQFDQLADRVSALGVEITAQLDRQLAASVPEPTPGENGNGNRAQRRAAPRRKPTKAPAG